MPVYGATLAPVTASTYGGVGGGNGSSAGIPTSPYAPRPRPRNAAVLILVDVTVGTTHWGTVEVRRGDDPRDLAERFADVTGLDERMIPRLTALIEYKLEMRLEELAASEARESRISRCDSRSGTG